jgi:hypothetical protein
MIRACFHPGQNRRAKTQKNLSKAASRGRMSSFQCRELLAKGHVFK